MSLRSEEIIAGAVEDPEVLGENFFVLKTFISSFHISHVCQKGMEFTAVLSAEKFSMNHSPFTALNANTS